MLMPLASMSNALLCKRTLQAVFVQVQWYTSPVVLGVLLTSAATTKAFMKQNFAAFTISWDHATGVHFLRKIYNLRLATAA